MEEFLHFAKEQAYAAGKIIHENFEKQVALEIKPDNSPVTELDTQINRQVIEAVKERYPHHGLYGEEESYSDGTEEYQWVCDPIDGTKPFILKLPNSTFILALLHKSQPILSLVYDPFTDRLYHAVKDGGAFCNDQQIRVNQSELQKGYFLTGSTSNPVFTDIKKAGAQMVPVSGMGYKVSMIADGRAMGMVSKRGYLHDIVVASLLVTEAGGKATNFQGGPLDFSKKQQEILISNGVAHHELLEIIQSNM